MELPSRMKHSPTKKFHHYKVSLTLILYRALERHRSRHYHFAV